MKLIEVFFSKNVLRALKSESEYFFIVIVS